MRTSQTVTETEINAYDKFCAEHSIVCDGSERGIANGKILGDLIMQGQQDITAQTLQSAYDQLRNRISHYTPAEVKIKSMRLSQDELDRVISFVENSPNLKSDGDNLLTNVATIASYMRQQRLPIHTLDNGILTRLANQSTQSFPLAWKTPTVAKKQESELSSHELGIYENRANSVEVRTPSGLVHNSKTAIVREIFVNGPDGKPDWKRTAIAREKAAAQN